MQEEEEEDTHLTILAVLYAICLRCCLVWWVEVGKGSKRGREFYQLWDESADKAKTQRGTVQLGCLTRQQVSSVLATSGGENKKEDRKVRDGDAGGRWV